METLTTNPQVDEQTPPLAIEQGYNTPLAKTEFQHLDPRFSDIAYHFTGEESLASIEQTGLKNFKAPYSPNGSGWNRLDHFLMSAKPPEINIDLERVVFGQLEQNELGTDLSFALRTSIDKGESIAIAIDPQETYVSSPRTREDTVIFLEHELLGYKASGMTNEQVLEFFWGQVMTLSKFRELYEPELVPIKGGKLLNMGWYLKDPDNEEKLGVPSGYGEVELLIPLEAGQDAIPPERLAHTASSLVGRNNYSNK